MKTIGLVASVVFPLLLAGCGSPATPTNPLVAKYSVNAPSGSTVTVEFGPDTNYGLTTSASVVPAGEAGVTVLVAGMRQKSSYHMRAITTLPDGTQKADADRVFTTGEVPADRTPATSVTVPPGPGPTPGVELLSLNPGKGSAKNSVTVGALDTSGNLIWYYDYDAAIGIAQPIKLLPNGHFLMVLFVGGNLPGGVVREIDLAGETVGQFSVSDLNRWLHAAGYTWTANALHHDILPLPNGHLLVLVNTFQNFNNLPGFTGTVSVLGDAVVDLDSGFNPVWAWSSFDHLDIKRHPLLFPDWTHTNALVYSPDDGNILLSMRHQGWILKIDYANGQGSGDILWRLGYQGDFTLQNSNSPADWFFAQHFANIVSPNSTGDLQIAMFDNGDSRVLDNSGTTCGSPGAPPCYSRPAIFEVNEDTLTANLLWNYPTVFSFWGGAIQELPNSDVFADITTPSDNPTGARSVELTQDPVPQLVWQLDINGQNSYRTLHLPSLYPDVQW